MRTLSFLQATVAAQREEMQRDEKVFLMGLDVSWDIMGTATGLLDEFGPERVRDAPIAENGYIGTAMGASMVGMRPIAEIEIAPFLYVAMDQLVSIGAKSKYIYGGQAKLPVTVRLPMMYAVSNAAQHSDRPYPTMMTIPGLKIVVASNALDQYGLLKSAIREDDPVLVFEDITCYGVKNEVPDPEEDFTVPLGKARVAREGSDVTVVALGGPVNHALKAAEELEKDGVSVEVVDLRSVVPLDRETVLESVAKTGRLVVADAAHEMGSVASEVAAIVSQHGFWDLQAPIQRVTTPHTHIPYARSMEFPLYPNPEKIVAAARATLD